MLLSEGYDSGTDESFFRPVGGDIEFGERGHEMVRVFECRIVGDWSYERDSLSAYEPDQDEAFQVCWTHPSVIEDGDALLYPEGLAALP